VELRADRTQRVARRLDVTLNLPGHHNVLNALAAISVAVEVGAPYPAIIKALEKFNGVARRFQRYGDLPLPNGGHFTLVDDYGHHPVEMAATLSAARGAFPGRRLVLAFQPHRYTRTRDCFEGFVKVLSTVDALVLTPVYAAGEAPIAGADSATLVAALKARSALQPVLVDDMAQLAQRVLGALQPGDVLVGMGAGSIGQLPGQLVSLTGGRA
jgi:UDP-N-acetylmuramate--alanine ligase